MITWRSPLALLMLLLALMIGATSAVAQRHEGRQPHEGRPYYRTAAIVTLFNATSRRVEFVSRFTPATRWETSWLEPGQDCTLRGPGTADVCEVGVATRGGAMQTYRVPFARVPVWHARDATGPVQSFTGHRGTVRLVPGRALTPAENVASIGQSIAGIVSALADLKHGNRIQVSNNSGGRIRLYLHYLPGRSKEWQTIGSWTLQPGEVSFLAHQNRELRTYNTVLYFFAEEIDGSRVWNGTLGAVCEGRALQLREYRKAADPDSVIRLPIDP